MYPRDNVIKEIARTRGVVSIVHAAKICRELDQKAAELLSMIRAHADDAKTFDVILQERASLYAVAAEAVSAIRSIMQREAVAPEPSSPAVDIVQLHLARISGVHLSREDIFSWSKESRTGPGGIFLLIGGPLVALALPCALGFARGVAEAVVVEHVDALARLLHAIWPVLLCIGTAFIAFGAAFIFGPGRRNEPRATDAATLIDLAISAGRDLAARTPKRQQDSILGHLGDGLGYWMVHSVALEQADTDDSLDTWSWRIWNHHFPLELAMMVWVTAAAAGEEPPAEISQSLGECIAGNHLEDPFHAIGKDLDEVRIGLAEGPERSKVVSHKAVQMLGIGLVALAGGVRGIRPLVQTGEQQLRAASLPYRARTPGGV